MQHTLTEAAKLTGKNRTTIWRHIKRGKLSAIKDRDGNPRVETTELIRVYGELQHPQTAEMQHPATPQKNQLSDELRAVISEAIEKATTPLLQELESLKEQLRLLEFKPTTPSTEPTKPEDDPDWPSTADTFSDLQKRREIRQRYSQKH